MEWSTLSHKREHTLTFSAILLDFWLGAGIAYLAHTLWWSPFPPFPFFASLKEEGTIETLFLIKAKGKTYEPEHVSTRRPAIRGDRAFTR
jgi:hypothetical protein